MAQRSLSIAVADRNPHVREFLCRELAKLGHWASAVSGPNELIENLLGPTPPQVLVLDPEAAGTRLSEVARSIRGSRTQVAVLLHVFADAEPAPELSGALVVEKEPSMAPLKAALRALAAQDTGMGNIRPQEKS